MLEGESIGVVLLVTLCRPPVLFEAERAVSEHVRCTARTQVEFALRGDELRGEIDDDLGPLDGRRVRPLMVLQPECW